MEVIFADGPVILDDTVGNPASIEAVFETARAMPYDRLRVVYAIRGARGLAINRHNAHALAALVGASEAQLIVTSSEDAADDRNRVSEEEQATVLGVLRGAGVVFAFEASVGTAVRRAIDASGTGDLILLLGAQGMDRGAEVAWAHLGVGRQE
jgi:UDP-N-acetylmuramoyl-L-alanyl-D-glutamate--2,6-diaminopimelate ligase